MHGNEMRGMKKDNKIKVKNNNNVIEDRSVVKRYYSCNAERNTARDESLGTFYRKFTRIYENLNLTYTRFFLHEYSLNKIIDG